MKALSRLKGLLEIVGLEVMGESVKAGAQSFGNLERENSSLYRSCNAETAGIK